MRGGVWRSLLVFVTVNMYDPAVVFVIPFVGLFFREGSNSYFVKGAPGQKLEGTGLRELKLCCSVPPSAQENAGVDPHYIGHRGVSGNKSLFSSTQCLLCWFLSSSRSPFRDRSFSALLCCAPFRTRGPWLLATASIQRLSINYVQTAQTANPRFATTITDASSHYCDAISVLVG